MNKQEETLVIDNISVAYDGMLVVRQVSLSIKAGETFGLIGLNGAGKTTLIKAVLGLRQCHEGAISVLGHPCGDAQAKAQTAYLPERFEPPWFLTGMEFLKFSLQLYRHSLNESEIIRQAARVALNPEDLKKRVQTYSKGMRQKLGLLGALLTGGDLFILDEPMSGLDPMARSLVKDLLREGKKNGKTIFFSSHVLSDMEEICDRIAILHEGEIRFTGKPADLKENTACATLERAFLHFIENRKAA